MKISVIASGSNGNCCLIENNSSSVLVDAGKSGREIESRMGKLGKSLEDVNGIILTHAHHDHVAGAGVLSKRFGIPLYMANETYAGTKLKLGKIEMKMFSVNKSFKIGSLRIKPVITSHNVSSCGFVFGKFGIFTDTGIVTKQMERTIPKLNGVLLESNHDIDMVINGHYPAFLKKWILSDEGHLSNIHASSLIQEKGKKLSLVLLGHLSGNNNSPDVAKNTFEKLVKRKIEYAVCSRDEESGSWSL
ncbi:MBL fold metallo-hydrolase [Candidatus Woesearchaeota archaeon]|nr:MBL fold metallo-hydrolase [Candidatus Woesearchaeota archaeon]|tara:strand:- start:1960 stop:2700 length:741 start_codon:yes stop_codon:yes gene_type:complete